VLRSMYVSGVVGTAGTSGFVLGWFGVLLLNLSGADRIITTGHRESPFD
jgi:hypothetical protein